MPNGMTESYDDEMEAWTYIQWPYNAVTEFDTEWDYMTGLRDTLPIRIMYPSVPWARPP